MSPSAAGSARRRCATTKRSAWSHRPGAASGGYRLYDDRALARLAFIARAKQLGCSLEEITDLATIWDGEQCRPVQRRFHDLVTDKIRTADTQIGELRVFADQLRRAADQLGRRTGRWTMRRRLRLCDDDHRRAARDGWGATRRKAGRSADRLHPGVWGDAGPARRVGSRRLPASPTATRSGRAGCGSSSTPSTPPSWPGWSLPSRTAARSSRSR